MTDDFNAAYEQFAARVEKKSFKGSSNGPQRTYEALEWTGLEPNKAKIIRAVGALPDTVGASPDTARTVTISWLVGDDGKKFRVIRPSSTEDPSYIINKIIAKVMKSSYVNGQKVFPVKESNPDIFNIIEKNGLASTDPKAKFERGWKGQEVLIMNVIDRAKIDWHRENKHTVLLANNINDSNGVTYVTEGISAASSLSRLAQIIGAYGSWEKYDIAITRTGLKDNPLIITNASHSPMEVADKTARAYISDAPNLTEEEASWERYDLQKLFRVTTYTKIYNRLKDTIKRIDGTLHTNFLDELEKRVAEEKVEWEKLYGEEGNEPSTQSIFTENVTPTISNPSTESSTIEVRQSVDAKEIQTRGASTKAPWELLPFGETIPETLRDAVLSVEKDASGKVVEIRWRDAIKDPVTGKEFPLALARCDNPNCAMPGPLELTSCPCCGKTF